MARGPAALMGSGVAPQTGAGRRSPVSSPILPAAATSNGRDSIQLHFPLTKTQRVCPTPGTGRDAVEAGQRSGVAGPQRAAKRTSTPLPTPYPPSGPLLTWRPSASLTPRGTRVVARHYALVSGDARCSPARRGLPRVFPLCHTSSSPVATSPRRHTPAVTTTSLPTHPDPFDAKPVLLQEHGALQALNS
ncbi:hypothetical protein E2C01_089587 [Portunus trituberculatus]|uniref:Uncharacterized protein n=1 Tax=Portunus trituberculatus TaxID=210409 RepID=A0A5B7JHM7_PORTR|nr:hypothetical protein [Portunus trituberculatus]